MPKLKQSFLTIVIGLALTAGLSYAWTGPTANPPENNASAPINVSVLGQIKAGALQVNGFRNVGNSIFDGSAEFKSFIKIPTGAGAGKVLTSDAEGKAKWALLISSSSIPQGTLCGSAFYEIAEESNHCWNLQQNASCNGSPIMTQCGVTVCPVGFVPTRTAYSWGEGSGYDGGTYRYYNMSCSKI